MAEPLGYAMTRPGFGRRHVALIVIAAIAVAAAVAVYWMTRPRSTTSGYIIIHEHKTEIRLNK